MYSTLSFTLAILSVFSIIELVKGNQKFSLLKYIMLGYIIVIAISSVLSYFEFTGFPIPYHNGIAKFINAGLVINMLSILAFKKIPKPVIIIETLLSLFFLFMIFSGFEFPSIINNDVQFNLNIYQKIIFFLSYLFFFTMVVYTFIKLVSIKSTSNLYDIKIRNWTMGLYVVMFLLIIINYTLVLLYLNGMKIKFIDSFITLSFLKFLVLLFILFRPKFLDDDKYARPFNQLLSKNVGVSFQSFEFLFYSNNYYLLPEANMDDLALKLNTTKKELANFLKNEIDENFTELLNMNRVEYFKTLLMAKKYESFTIEALSEMSGFNNRRSMYNSFKKHVGITPTEFIQSLK